MKYSPLEMEIFTASWDSVQTTGHHIFQSAQDENWEETIEWAEQRHGQLLIHFDEFPIDAENSEHYRLVIEEMIRSESKLKKIIDQARIKLSAESQQLRNQKQGVDAYQLSGM